MRKLERSNFYCVKDVDLCVLHNISKVFAHPEFPNVILRVKYVLCV